MAFDVVALNDWVDERSAPFLTFSVINSETNEMISKLPGLKTETKLPKLDADYDILQSNENCAFNASGDITTTQVSINPVRLKVNMEFCVKDLEKKFYAQILPAGSSYEGLQPAEAGFLQLIQSRIQKVVELLTWHGEQGGADAVASLNLVDGIKHVVADAIAAGDIPASQDTGDGALTNSNIVGILENMRNALPASVYGDVNTESGYVIFMSAQSKQKYDENYRNTYGANTNNTEFSRTFLDGTRIELMPVSGLTARDDEFLMLVKRDKVWYGFDVDGEEDSLRVGMDQYEENVWVKSQFKSAWQLSHPEEVVVYNA